MTWDTLPAPNFVPLGQIIAILSYLSPHFYSHDVEILLKRTDLRIRQRHKILSKSLMGPAASIALPRGGHGLPVLHCLGKVMHIDF